MNNKYLHLVATALFLFSATTAARAGGSIAIGETVQLRSDILHKEIQLSIHVPEGGDSTDRYPVLYTFQTHFEQVAGAVKNLYDYSLTPKMMVVRIDNYEFGYLTPTKIESNPNSGRAGEFLDFFEKELFPFVDANYRTHPFRIVFSNSWGAMFVTWGILSRPGVFDAGVASIPWIMYDGEDRFLLNHTRQYLEQGGFHNFLYLTMDDELELLADLPLFVDMLRENPTPGLEWEYHHWPEEDHTSTPYRSVHSGLRALYRGWNTIPDEVSAQGVAGIGEYERELGQKFGYAIGVSGTALRLAGQALQKQSKFDEAIAVYRYAIAKDPKNPFAYVSLGRACEAAGRWDEAREAYEQGYQMAESTSHPQVKWVRSFLDRVNERIGTEGD